MDPTFREPQRLHRSAILQEATGYFLVPRQLAPPAWTPLGVGDASAVVGRGFFSGPSDVCDELGCPYGTAPGGYGNGGGGLDGGQGCGAGCSAKSGGPPGVLQWFISDPFVNLWLIDTPLRYQPALGPEFAVHLIYKQRPSDLFTQWNPAAFTQVGQGWTLPWRGAMLVGPRDQDGNQTMSLYSPTWAKFSYAFVGSGNTTVAHFINNSRLERVIDGNQELSSAKVWYPDGSCDEYATKVLSGGGDLVRLVLTRKTDANGRSVTVQYHSNPDYPEENLIARVLDPDGQPLNFTYSTEAGYTNRVEELSDWTGRTVAFDYDPTYPYMLKQITDPVLMRSQINYQDGSGDVSSIVTPYGTTTFSHAQYEANGLKYRCITVTRPTGARERFYFEIAEYVLNVNSMDPLGQGYAMPSGTPYGDNFSTWFLDRNSYYWDSRNFENLSSNFKNSPSSYSFTANDAMRGRGRHWLAQWDDSGWYTLYQCLNAERAPSPGSGRGQITWYDYADKPDPDTIGSQILPGVVARVMPDGSTWYDWSQRNDQGKVETEIEKWVTAGQTKLRTNTFIYAANGVDLIEHRFGPSGGDHRVVGYAYDDVNYPHLPIRMTNAIGEVTTNFYDTNLRLTGVATPAGLVTTNYYGADKYLASSIDSITGTPLRTNSYTYARNHVFTATDPRGLTVTYTYDDLGRMTEKSSGGSYETWSFGIASAYPNSTGDLQIYETTAYHDRMLTNVTLTSWTADRKVDTLTNPSGMQTHYTYCDCGAVESVTQAYGLANAETTWYFYDQQSRLTQITQPDSSVVQYGYDLPGRRTYAVDSVGNWIYTYDNLSRLVAVNTPYGQIQGTAYDGEDRPVTAMDANGVTVTSTFDDLGRVLTRTYPDTGVERFLYSVKDLVAYTNQIGKVTRYDYDAALRKTAETNANLEVVRYQYKPSGDLWKLIDGKNQTNTWNYDQYGRVTNKLDQANVEILTYAYDANSRLTNRWSKAKLNTKYQFDAVGNLTKVDYNTSPDITLQYDVLGRLTNEVTAGTFTNSYTYRPGGQLWTENGPWDSDTVTNYYNTSRMRMGLGLAQPTGAWTNGFTYDGAHRLATVISPAGTFTYSYKGPANLVTNLALPNTSRITNAFDSVARLTSTRLLTSLNSLLDSYAYVYNLASQRTQHTRTDASTVAYTYDAIGQLKSAIGSGGQSTENLGYLYDTAWNLNKRTNAGTPTTFSVDVKNQLTTVGSDTCTYDNNGNLTYYGTSGNWQRYFTYDDENQLLSAQVPGYGYYTYAYDGRGRLRKRVGYTWTGSSWTPNSTNLYVYDGMRVIQERDHQNAPAVAYTLGNDLSGSLEGAGGIGGMLARSHGYSGGTFSTHSFYHADGNGNITYLATSAQGLAASYRYDPYGNTLASSGTLATANTYRFSSKPAMDIPSLSLYYYGYRFYAPNLQRWLNRDPLGEWGTINLHVFSANSPIDYIDQFGLAPQGTFIIRSISGLPVADGQLKSAGGNTSLEGFEVEYGGKCDCPRDQIVLVQAIKSSGGTGEGPHMDASSGQRSRNASGEDTRLPPYTGCRGNHGQLSFCDAPFNPRKFYGETTFTMEVCAVCRAAGKERVLGCVTFTFGDVARTPAVPGGSARPNGDGMQITAKNPGKLWRDALKQWNDMRGR